jgi:hypothetical protein
VKIVFRIIRHSGETIDCGDFGFDLVKDSLDVISYIGSRVSGLTQKSVCNLKRVCRGFGRTIPYRIMVQSYYELDYERIIRRRIEISKICFDVGFENILTRGSDV